MGRLRTLAAAMRSALILKRATEHAEARRNEDFDETIRDAIRLLTGRGIDLRIPQVRALLSAAHTLEGRVALERKDPVRARAALEAAVSLWGTENPEDSQSLSTLEWARRTLAKLNLDPKLR